MTDQQHDIFGDDTHGNDLLALEIETLDDHRWPRVLAELVDVYTAAARREGMADDESQARRMARWIVLTLGQHLGGRQTYIPRGDDLKTAIKHNQIWADFDGKNINDLVCKYKLTSVQIYKIISEQRALHRAKVQPQLPFGDSVND